MYLRSVIARVACLMLSPHTHRTLPPPPSPPQVKHMALHIGSADGQPDHAFPHLAGSHLTEQQLVRGAWEKLVCSCRAQANVFWFEWSARRRRGVGVARGEQRFIFA